MIQRLAKSLHFEPLFLKLALSYWLFGLILLAFTKQGDVVLFINSLSCPQLDVPMRFITELGHGTFAALIVLIVLILNIKNSIHLILTFGFTALLANMGKRLFFHTNNRPLWYFNYADFHRVLDSAPLNYLNSFPSGHTMTAFALAATLAFLFHRKWSSVLLFTYAILVGLSRIYMCQHFFVDTFWGALLGMTSSALAGIIMSKWINPRFSGTLNQGIGSLIKTFLMKKPNQSTNAH